MDWKTLAITGFVVAGVAVGWGAAQGAARGGLSPQDYIDIQELYATYARAYDTDEGEGKVYADTFVPDGKLVLRDREIVGHAALASYSHDREKSGPFAQHWNANLIVRPAPGGATASVYLLIVTAAHEGKPPALTVVSNYNDVMVKTAEGWRFKSRTPGRQIAPIRE